MSVDTLLEIQPAPLSATRYRQGRKIPDHIREHCHIYLDEQLYVSALNLLGDLITVGVSHSTGEDQAVLVPSPYHLELVSCLLIHPRYTTQAPPNERSELAAKSITLLRNVLAILGPVNANLKDAFCLLPVESRGARRGRRVQDFEEATSGSESEDKSEHMTGVIANRGRIRRCAKDFWHMVGWAFNCSIQYPRRWRYWKVWLGYMLEVLDVDWQERTRIDKDDEKYQALLKVDPTATCSFKMVRQGLLVQYLSNVRSSTSVRRAIRSAFADGGAESLKDFPEVFQNETREVKYNGQKRKRDDQFAKYDDEEDFEPLALTDDLNESVDGTEDPWLGGTESIALRQRVITLLSRAAAYLPDTFTDVKELYDSIYLCARPLPLPAFSHFMSPSSSTNLPQDAYISLCQILLSRFLESKARLPHTISGHAGDDLSQDILEQCFLPYCARTSSIEDNAKVSILVENLFRLFLKSCECFHTPDLHHAIHEGILARENKVKSDKRRNNKRNKSEDEDLIWLTASGRRLRTLLAWVEKKSQDGTG